MAERVLVMPPQMAEKGQLGMHDRREAPAEPQRANRGHHVLAQRVVRPDDDRLAVDLRRQPAQVWESSNLEPGQVLVELT